VAFIESVGLLLPVPRPASPEEVASAPDWRGACEYPGSSPAEMAIHVGRAALMATATPPSVAGLVQLAESGELQEDSIVLLLAAEYQLGATAVVLHIIKPPVVSVDGLIRTIA
jgi:hypothetical protein